MLYLYKSFINVVFDKNHFIHWIFFRNVQPFNKSAVLIKVETGDNFFLIKNTTIMNYKNMNFSGLLVILLISFSMTLQAQNDEKVIIKKTTNKNGQERVEKIVTKNGKTKVTVTVDGKEVKEEKIESDDETIIIKNGDQTFFIEEVEELTDELELTFEDLEIKLNNLDIPNFRMGVLEEETTNDDEGYLGAEVKEKKKTVDGETTKMVIVTDVYEESAALEAGLEVGDIITAIDGKKVRSLSQFMHLIKANAPDETITIDYIRADKAGQTTATLKQKKGDNFILFGEEGKIKWNEKGRIEWNGDEDFSIQLPRRNDKGVMGVTLGKTVDEGVELESVKSNSAAEKAGLEKGDIITAIDNQAVKSKADLLEVLEDKKPNETVDITYLRNNKIEETKVVLKKSNSLFSFNNDDAQIKLEDKDGNWNFEWIEDADDVFVGVILGDEVTEGIEIDGTVDNSAAEAAGLEKGDIITAIDGETVKTQAELINKLNEYKTGESVEITYLRDGQKENVTVKLGTKVISIRKPNDINIIFGEDKETNEEIFEDVKMPEVIPADEQLEMMQMDLYPNPSEGEFNLNFETEANPTVLKITNEKGDTVFTKEMAKFNGVFSDKIDITAQPSGTYYLTISQGDKKIMKRVNVVK